MKNVKHCDNIDHVVTSGQAPFHIDRESYHLHLDAIPAWICSQCGEVYFEEKEVELIQLIQDLDKKTKKIASL